MPLYHCELNSIEMVWNQAKRFVYINNFDFKTDDIRSLIDEAFESITEQNWRNCVAHVKEKTEKETWVADNL